MVNYWSLQYNPDLQCVWCGGMGRGRGVIYKLLVCVSILSLMFWPAFASLGFFFTPISSNGTEDCERVTRFILLNTMSLMENFAMMLLNLLSCLQ